MDGELLRALYHRLFSDPSLNHTRKCDFSDAMILFIWFFAVINNVSSRQAQMKKHWPICYRRLAFPGYSQLRKRLNTEAIESHIQRLNDEFRDRLPRTDDKVADGKPLVVGGYTKDPDAQSGHTPDGWGKGYKLHVLADSAGPIERFDVTPLPAGEPTTLRFMLQDLDLNHAVVRADSNYDSNPTYQAIDRCGGMLIAPRKKPGRGIGHHPQHPHRIAAIERLEGNVNQMKLHKRSRNRVEQILGHLTGLPFGLAYLPNFVRRLHRVKRWVAAKIALYHLHLSLQLNQHAAA